MGQCSACYEGLEALWQRDLPAPNSGSVRLPWRRWRPRHVAHERNAARAQRHWGKLRALVWAQIAFRLLLQELRIREVCRLYDEDWSEVGTPSLRRPSLNWRKVQALASTSAAALQELLNEVRSKQAENLYAADWSALATTLEGEPGPVKIPVAPRAENCW
ncbi:unnamed protein product [Durusdinium trenchii]|uniref:Uncharacterized protein n=1 Tax=Durusdinium trenchii TaxID=1381693 RepID=A0ABP0PT64_9DINO